MDAINRAAAPPAPGEKARLSPRSPADLPDIPTPYYLIDESLIVHNLEILAALSRRTGCKILLAQKAFSFFPLYPLIGKYLHGTAASGLYEARLGAEAMGGENHIYSPAYRPEEFARILDLCDHLIFNSFGQWLRFREQALAAGRSCGIRVNPEYSTQSRAVYDPCAPGSRLGVTAANFRPDLLEGIEGLHFHTLCEQGAAPLAATAAAVEEKFGPWLSGLRWINLGGGHHITKADYDMAVLEDCINGFRDRYGLDVYLEPGEAVALDAGYFVSAVLALEENGAVRNAILDGSGACHLPDVLEGPYRPEILGAGKPREKAHTYRLGGPTCLAGDILGDYSFDRPLQVGDRLIFLDMAHYTMVKNNTFNGMPLPAIVTGSPGRSWRAARQFGYGDFKNRLG